MIVNYAMMHVCCSYNIMSSKLYVNYSELISVSMYSTYHKTETVTFRVIVKSKFNLERNSLRYCSKWHVISAQINYCGKILHGSLVELLNRLSPPLVLTRIAMQYSRLGSRPVMLTELCSKRFSLTETVLLSTNSKLEQFRVVFKIG